MVLEIEGISQFYCKRNLQPAPLQDGPSMKQHWAMAVRLIKQLEWNKNNRLNEQNSIILHTKTQDIYGKCPNSWGP